MRWRFSRPKSFSRISTAASPGRGTKSGAMPAPPTLAGLFRAAAPDAELLRANLLRRGVAVGVPLLAG